MTVPSVPVSIADAVISAPTSARLTPPAPLAGFAPEAFKARRDKLRALCSDGIVVLRGATEDEVVKPGNYRQNATFFYFTGVDTPGAFLVLLPQGVSAGMGLRGMAPDVRELLFVPARNPVAELWSGPKLGPGEETQSATGIEKVVDAASFWAALTAWVRINGLLYTVAPYGDKATLTPDFALIQELARRAPVVQIRDVMPAVAQLRIIKSPAEVERMRQAIAITVEGQKAARALLATVHADGPTRYEHELEGAVFAAFRSRGARLAFASITGGGHNATVLHYEDNHHALTTGDLVVVDIGALVDYYCGDITRTYPAGGKFTPRQRDLYNLVRDAHERVISSFKPGEDSTHSLDERCKAFLHDSPLRAQDADGREQTMRAFMPHGLSHHLGLDVHDLLPYVDRTAPLMPGSVITIEPGVYVASEGIGVRLESDYLVTETGLERLDSDLDMNRDAVEQAMQQSQ